MGHILCNQVQMYLDLIDEENLKKSPNPILSTTKNVSQLDRTSIDFFLNNQTSDAEIASQSRKNRKTVSKLDRSVSFLDLASHKRERCSGERKNTQLQKSTLDLFEMKCENKNENLLKNRVKKKVMESPWAKISATESIR